jgi:glycerol uptake facilitator protein
MEIHMPRTTPSASIPVRPGVPLGRTMLAEGFGTFLLVFFGCGVVHTAILMNAQSGLWQVAVVWGLAVMLAVFAVDAVSGAHINPAITISFAVWGKHPWARVVPYILSQMLGAFLAAGVLFVLFGGFLEAKEKEKGVVRGEPGSIVTAMCYGEYFPNPGSLATTAGPFDRSAFEALASRVTQGVAIFAEVIGTMILACVVFALTDKRNRGRPLANLAPVFIGLTISALISIIAPLTQACFNPARDFGPRLFAYFAGWGSVAIPGLSEPGWLTVYILAPIVGAILGGGFYEFALRPAYPDVEPALEKQA